MRHISQSCLMASLIGGQRQVVAAGGCYPLYKQGSLSMNRKTTYLPVKNSISKTFWIATSLKEQFPKQKNHAHIFNYRKTSSWHVIRKHNSDNALCAEVKRGQALPLKLVHKQVSSGPIFTPQKTKKSCQYLKKPPKPCKLLSKMSFIF